MMVWLLLSSLFIAVDIVVVVILVVVLVVGLIVVADAVFVTSCCW